MTFTEIVDEILDRLELNSDDAEERIGRAVNRLYRSITTSIGLNTTRTVLGVLGTITPANSHATFTGVEKIVRVYETSSGTPRELKELSLLHLQEQRFGTGVPSVWAVQTSGSTSVTLRFNTVAQANIEIRADGVTTVSTLSGSDVPVIPVSFHDVLVEGVLVDEYKKLEKLAYSRDAKMQFEQRLSDLRYFIAKSAYQDIRQGHLPNSGRFGAGSSSGGGSSLGTTSYTQTGLILFDRDPLSPFEVTSGSAVVENLDADMVDGRHEDEFVLLAGRAGGQAIIGGTGASELLELTSTSHGTKGSIFTEDLLFVQPVTAAQIGIYIDKDTQVATESTSACMRVHAYSPSIELLDKDGVQNWYLGLDDNDNNAFHLGKGYGPGQGLSPLVHIDPTSNRIGVGTDAEDAPNGAFSVASDSNNWVAWFRVEDDAANNEALMRLEHFSDVQVTLPIITGIANRGTIASRDAIESGDYLLVLDGRGFDGSSTDHGEYELGVSDTRAQIAFLANQNWTGSAHGTRIEFKTTPNGSTTPVEAMEITDAGTLSLTKGQLKFPAAQNASSDANTLDDYEEGDWTPVIGGSGGTSGQTYATQLGKYTKTGRQVVATFIVALSAKGTITTNVQVQGLPFTSGTDVYGANAVEWSNLAANKVAVALELVPGATAVTVVGAGAAAASLAALATADIANNTQLIGTVTYFV